MFLQRTEFPCFLKAEWYSIVPIKFYLCIHLLMDNSVDPLSWLWRIVLPQMWECRCLLDILCLFPLHVYSALGSGDHLVDLLFICWGPSTLSFPNDCANFHLHQQHVRFLLFSVFLRANHLSASGAHRKYHHDHFSPNYMVLFDTWNTLTVFCKRWHSLHMLPSFFPSSFFLLRWWACNPPPFTELSPTLFIYFLRQTFTDFPSLGLNLQFTRLGLSECWDF